MINRARRVYSAVTAVVLLSSTLAVGNASSAAAGTSGPVWTQPLSSAVGWSAPMKVTSDGTVIAVSCGSNGRGTALSAFSSTGTRRWSLAPASGDLPNCDNPAIATTDAVGGSYWATMGPDPSDLSSITAIDASGARRWTYPLPGCVTDYTRRVTSMTAGPGGNIYFLQYNYGGSGCPGTQYYLGAVSASDGRILFHREVSPLNYVRDHANLFAYSGGLVLFDGRTNVRVLDFKGEILREYVLPTSRYGFGSYTVATAALGSDGSFVRTLQDSWWGGITCNGDNNAEISRLDLGTGRSWSYKFPTQENNACIVVADLSPMPDGGIGYRWSGGTADGSTTGAARIDGPAGPTWISSATRPAIDGVHTRWSNNLSVGTSGQLLLTSSFIFPCSGACTGVQLDAFDGKTGKSVSGAALVQAGDNPASYGQYPATAIGTDQAYVSTAYCPGRDNVGCGMGIALHALAFPELGSAYPSPLSSPVTPSAPETPTDPNPSATSAYYVALGDSFSAGEGAPDWEDGKYAAGTDTATNRCHRSRAAYPAQLQVMRYSNESFVFRACSGAVIRDFFASSQAGHGDEPGQLQWLGEQTEVVTLTIGGNDVSFGDVMDYCAKRFGFEPTCREVWDGPVSRAITALGYGLPGGQGKDNLPDLYQAIRRAAPNAEVLVLGYPRFFPKSPPRSCWTGVPTPTAVQPHFTRQDMLWMNEKVLQLNKVIQRSAEVSGVTYVESTYQAFNGRELCNRGRQPEWMHRVRLPLFTGGTVESFHPNDMGHSALASHVYRKIDQLVGTS